MSNLVQISGILAIIGAAIYAIGDVLLLADKVGPVKSLTGLLVDLTGYPPLQRRAHRLVAMARLPRWRLVWGGLLGVFAAPLTLAGVWQVYQGLQPAGIWWALPPTLLFAYATVIGPFIHGSFIHLGATVQTLNALQEADRPLLVEELIQQQTILLIAYSVLFVCLILASLWFSVAVGWGQTRFPWWMVAVNPLTITLAWLASKKFLPQRLADYTEGAGFNIAYIIFFGLTTAMLW
ncbi:MAG: hypothetical protein DYG89_11585 [Caldilinea sp. CFX5]|nr:hypothetical protein [Caldilinea sp. CFX5]